LVLGKTLLKMPTATMIYHLRFHYSFPYFPRDNNKQVQALSASTISLLNETPPLTFICI